MKVLRLSLASRMFLANFGHFSALRSHKMVLIERSVPRRELLILNFYGLAVKCHFTEKTVRRPGLRSQIRLKLDLPRTVSIAG